MIIKGQSTSNNRFVCKMSFICQMTKAIDYDLQFAGGGGHHELLADRYLGQRHFHARAR